MGFRRSTAPLSSAELQRRWWEQSCQAGWIFSSDWYDPAVDAVCEACVSGTDLWPSAQRLGSARAGAGVSLGETLADVDELTNVAPGVPPDVLQRAVALGWAEESVVPAPAVFDPLTGLVSVEYLRIRLGEVYRGADVAGTDVSDTHALVVVAVELAGMSGWDRVTPLLLAGDAMRTVFDGEHTLARLADHMAVVLTPREEMLPRRSQLLLEMLTDRLSKAGPVPGSSPRIWIERLPTSLSAAVGMIQELGR